jgi:hypothetical protein
MCANVVISLCMYGLCSEKIGLFYEYKVIVNACKFCDK